MPAEETVDEEVALGSNRRVGNAGTARGVIHEAVDPTTGDTQVISGKSAMVEDVGDAGATPRRFKASTEALLAKLEAPQGDGGPDDPDDPDNATAASAGESEGGEVAAEDGTESTDETPAATEEINEWQQKVSQYEQANRQLLAELDSARKTPSNERSDYEQTLVDAWKSYVDEGSTVAIRKFIGAVIGAAPDSKEVAAELSGAYIDLTANEVGVPLDDSQQAKREAARARLQLARDKRERAESEKKATSVNSGEAQQIEQAGRYIDEVFATKGQNGASYAEEFPLTYALAERWDGMKPGKLLATTIRHEIKVGNLTGREPEDVLIRHAARQVEKHYNDTLELGNKAKPQSKPKQTDTTKSGTPAAKPASQDKRQSTGAHTINNAKASVAPATPPKTKKQEQPKVEEKPKFRSKREAQDFALRHIPE